MSPDYKAGMMRAAEICEKQGLAYNDSASHVDGLDEKVHLMHSSITLLNITQQILSAIESGAGEDKP